MPYSGFQTAVAVLQRVNLVQFPEQVVFLQIYKTCHRRPQKRDVAYRKPQTLGAFNDCDEFNALCNLLYNWK